MGVEPVVPETKSCQKRDGWVIPGSDNGKQIWKKIRFTGTINTSRFENGFWNGLLEEGTHQDDVEQERSIETIKAQTVLVETGETTI